MFLLIDNYDSFTYNLVQAFQSLGMAPHVVFNDDPKLLDLVDSEDLEMVCISPGPGHPRQAGLCLEFLERLSPQIPVLGICLGHQLLGLFAGAKVEVGPCIMHGKQSEIVHDGMGIFRDVTMPMKVGRYHSLVVRKGENTVEGKELSGLDSIADDYVNSENSRDFTVTARGPEGEVMALQYKHRPWVGVQFHPESVLTPDGLRMLANFPQAISTQENAKLDMRSVLECLAQKKDLTGAMAASSFAALMDGRMTQAQAGAFLMSLRMKGESALEMAHAVRAALARAVRVDGITSPCIDVVGTGGDGRSSFNCSTATSLVLAGLGHKVIKHGNRAVSSKCGSADALEALGVALDADPKSAVDAVKSRNFAFLFAPHFHPAFKNVGPLRKELGMRTLFNLLGPMINPARPSHLLMGVARPELIPLIAETLQQSPLQRAAIIYGAGGYDEITPIGPATVALLENGRIEPLYLDPAQFGFAPCTVDDLTVHSKEEAVAVLKELLQGKGPQAMLDMIALNVGLSLYLLEGGQNQQNQSLDACMHKARHAVAKGVGQAIVDSVTGTKQGMSHAA